MDDKYFDKIDRRFMRSTWRNWY